MNIKLVLGVIIPLVIIGVLATLSNSKSGFIVDKQSVESVDFNSLFTNSYGPTANIPLQTITISNDFFLPRKYQLPTAIVCLNDKKGVMQRTTMQAGYSEGVSSPNSDVPIFYDLSVNSYGSNEKSLEMPANSKKQVKLMAASIYSYDNTKQNYQSYNEILVVIPKKTPTDYYNGCAGLSSEDLAAAEHIPISRLQIIQLPLAAGSSNNPLPKGGPNCTDTDGGKNIYLKGIASASLEAEMDSCSSSTRLLEWWCRTTGSDRPEGYYADCPQGYGCQDGACVSIATS